MSDSVVSDRKMPAVLDWRALVAKTEKGYQPDPAATDPFGFARLGMINAALIEGRPTFAAAVAELRSAGAPADVLGDAERCFSMNDSANANSILLSAANRLSEQ